jgi:quinol monooxygenase YgiN
MVATLGGVPRNGSEVCFDNIPEARMAQIQGNNSEIRELARYELRPESLERCLSAIHEFVTYVRAAEPGALRYEVWQESEHPTRFVHIFIWRDAEANRIHGESAAVKKFAGILYPNCLAPVEFIEYKQVDANAAFRRL